MMLLTSFTFYACKDNDGVSTGDNDRELMTMFRKTHNTDVSNDPYACGVVSGNGLNEKAPDDNAIHLYWYAIEGCKGYQVRLALQPDVANGPDAWAQTETDKKLVYDVILPPNVTDVIIPDLQYKTDYRAAIRVLSNKDADGVYDHASKWYGHGDGRQWGEYMQIQTNDRYEFPEIITQANVEDHSFRIKIQREVEEFVNDEGYKNGSYLENFNVAKNAEGKDVFQFKYLTIEPSGTNPNAKVPEKWKKYEITEEDFARGYIDVKGDEGVDGFDQNSVYTVNIEDPEITSKKCYWDAIFNTLSVRTTGPVGDPFPIPHEILEPKRENYPSDDAYETAMVQFEAMQKYDAARIDTILSNYNSDNTLAEGQVFYLEGGKNYVLFNNVSLCKGMTLATNPKDLEPGGPGRANVFLSGIHKVGTAVQSMNFMFGRQPLSGELGGIYIQSLIFEDINFDAPLCQHYDLANNISGQGNYFINMYSNGMAVTMKSFEMRRCKVERAVRGFIRVQGSKVKLFEKVLVEDCEFYNDGFYDNNGRGYAWVAGDGASPKSNIFMNMIFRNNTFYDSPRTAFFTDNSKQLAWKNDIQYNITFNNNTIVNFSTRSTGRYIFDLRYLPAGSKIECKNNLFVLAKQAGDSRPLSMGGMDIRDVVNAPYTMVYDIANNWSTSDNLTNGQIFSQNAFSAAKNAAGAHADWNVGGADALVVKDAGISNADLFVNVNPPYTDDYNKHSVAFIDGSGTVTRANQDAGITKGVDLHFKNTTNEIVKNNVGDPRWYNTINKAKSSKLSRYIAR